MRRAADQVLALLSARKRIYQQRRPGIIAIISEAAVRSLLEQGILARRRCRTRCAARCREVAAAEMTTSPS